MTCVSIARGDIFLGNSAIVVVAPWSNEGSEVAIIYMQRNAVVTILCVKDGLFCAVVDGAYLVEWRLHVVSLMCGMQVKSLEMYCPHWFTVLFWADNHSMAPGDQIPNWHWFDDTKVDILISSRQCKGTGSGLW